MLFPISPGSTGSGPERYVASVPFILPGDRLIQVPEPFMSELPSGEVLTLERLQLRYTLSLGSYPTPGQAAKALDKLTAALLWAALACQTSLRYPVERGAVQLHKQPMQMPSSEPMAHIGHTTGWAATDGHYDADLQTVRPEHLRLVRFEGGQAHISAGIAAPNFVAALAEALAWPKLSDISQVPKLRLAVEVFAAHRFEASTNARFLTLVTSLEALLPDGRIGEPASVALRQARQSALAVRDTYTKESPEWAQIEHLCSRISKLEQESIGASLRSYVHAAVSRMPCLGAPDECAKRVRDAYHVRSRLLHDGYAAPDRLIASSEWLQTFVPALLKGLIQEVVGRTEEDAA